MTGYLEEEFWENLVNKNIRSIDVLIENNFDLAAFKLMNCLIDSLSGFYSPDKTPGKRFYIFIKKYMPNMFNQVNFKDAIRFINKPEKKINHVGDILYEAFRCGAVHDGFLGLGISLYRDKELKILWSGEGIEIIRINILGFYEYLKKAIEDFKIDIDKNNEISNCFKIRFNRLNKPLFKLNKKAEI